MTQETMSEMLNKYYSTVYIHGERNKAFVEVSTPKGNVFISPYVVASIEKDKDGTGILFDKHGKTLCHTKVPFIELAMMFELATKRVPEKPQPNPQRENRHESRNQNKK